MTQSIDPGFIKECEREQLHRAAAIQPAGTLIGGRIGADRIDCVGANLSDWLKSDPEQLLGAPRKQFGDLLSGESAAGLEAVLWQWDDPGLADSAPNRVVIPSFVTGPRGLLDAVISRNGPHWLLELQPAVPAAERVQAHRPVPHELYRIPGGDQAWEKHCLFLADAIRDATGFERVMLYRFRKDGAGEVIAESLADGLAPYLGLRYPASDIPQIARNLYVANRHRQIPDVDAPPVPLLSGPHGAPDLTRSDLRAVSPVHIQYMKNMSVAASLSFSIAVHGELWGLVACHHSSPRTVPLPVRERCADMAQVFTLAIAGYETTRRLQIISSSDREIEALIKAFRGPAADGGPSERLERALLELVDAGGAAMLDRDRLHLFGLTPPREHILVQADWVFADNAAPIFATDALPDLCPSAAAYAPIASGLLAVRIRQAGGGERLFLWWRPEQPQTIRWAGDPRTKAVFDAQSQVLSPRSSFDLWIETSRGHSDPWTDGDLLKAKKFRSLVLHDINAALLAC
ncbi:MAG: GAF domain-containing protein [Thiohalocapsa sp.]|nr:GAF domain-containing protein [Thiohalocapsa sp.]